MNESLDWHGVAMVEFWIDSRDGKPKLMEINPRFWGTDYDVLSLRDPMPALGAILEGMKSMTSKERRSHAFDRGW